MSVKLSPKHGVNPAMARCVWCGKADRIVLLGRLKGDAEAPKDIFFDYEPCPKCAAGQAQGLTIVEVQEEPQGNLPPFQHGVWMTGRWWVIKEEAAQRMFSPEFFEQIKVSRKMLVTREMAKTLGFVGDQDA